MSQINVNAASCTGRITLRIKEDVPVKSFDLFRIISVMEELGMGGMSGCGERITRASSPRNAFGMAEVK
jgi:hypothetical protein